VLGRPQGPAGHRQHRGGQPAGVPVAVGQLLEPALHPGRGRLDLPGPGGHDQAGPVRSLGIGGLGDDFDPATLPAMAEAYGCQVDFEGTAAVVERYGLRF
jgi:hypothetical protein